MTDEYTPLTEQTFNQIYSQFIHTQSNDLFKRNIRSLCRDKIMKDNDTILFNQLKAHPKNVIINNTSIKLDNPFTLSNLSTLSSIQEATIEHSKMLKYFGNYSYTASCGSGKTLAGIYLIHYLSCKTLIISSRNAVNDQWKYTLKELYPELKICTRTNRIDDPDVWIYSPQFLTKRLDTININPSLIIYDEVHSLMSPNFIKVLLYPLMNVINANWNELPYMIALTATLQANTTREYRDLSKIFGKPFHFDTTITNIPVYVYDYYDHYIRYDKDNVELKPPESRGFLDNNYKPLSDIETLVYFTDKIDEEKIYDPTDTNYKGIIMTYNIDSSVFAALYVHVKWNINVILIRSVDESSIFLPKNTYMDYDFDETITLDKIHADKIGVPCEYEDHIKESSVIVGTVHRLKEGFSVQNIVWGICTQFIYGLISRIQLIGRIRRNSNNEELNNKKRTLYVCSGKKPSNLMSKYKKQVKKFTYDDETECKKFIKENYIRI